MRTQLWRKCWRQLIPPVFRILLCPLYMLQIWFLYERPITILRYEWREDSTFQKKTERTHTSYCTMTFISFLHSGRFSLLRSPTSILRYEWREKTIFPNVSLVQSRSLSRVRRKTTFSFTSEMRTELSRKCWRQLTPPVLRWLLCVLYILEGWVLYDAQQVFSVMSDVRTNFFRKCRRQLIPPVLPWFWCLLYFLQV